MHTFCSCIRSMGLTKELNSRRRLLGSVVQPLFTKTRRLEHSRSSTVVPRRGQSIILRGQDVTMSPTRLPRQLLTLHYPPSLFFFIVNQNKYNIPVQINTYGCFRCNVRKARSASGQTKRCVDVCDLHVMSKP